MKEITTSVYTFKDMIEGGCLYVDKTAYLHRMVSATKGQFFLARPRRFGKSLTVSTLEAIFRGRQDLFRGLAIEARGYRFEEYPVIHLDFAAMRTATPEKMADSICRRLSRIAEEYGLSGQPENAGGAMPGAAVSVEAGGTAAVSGVGRSISYSIYESPDPAERFAALIDTLYDRTGKGVVLLIDEYDKPLIDHLSDGRAEAMRTFMDDFYQVIKGAEPELRFVLITGVTKFSKVSVFSKLNSLTDITMDRDYACLCGYTQAELEENFAEYMAGPDFQSLTADDGRPLGQDGALQLLRHWYDGFCFCAGCENVYNPVSVGRFFAGHCAFRNYWFSTGTPSFLMDLIRRNHLVLSDMDGAVMTDSSFNVFDITELAGCDIQDERIVQLLFQTGYLTLDRQLRTQPQTVYSLRFPNHEVSLSFAESLVKNYYGNNKPLSYVNGILNAAENGDTKEIIDLLKDFFANLPYDIQIRDEKYYQSMTYAIFKMCAMDVTAEERTNIGRIDAVLKAGRHLYIIEFKLNKTAEEAAAQIDSRQYPEKYLRAAQAGHLTIHRLGINFDYTEGCRNISDWKEERSPRS